MDKILHWIGEVMPFFIFLIIVVGLGWVLYKVGRSFSDTATENRCSKIAWSAAKEAGMEAGKAADNACRKTME